MLPCFGSNPGHENPHHEHMQSFTSGGIFASLFTKGQDSRPSDYWAWRLSGNCCSEALFPIVVEPLQTALRQSDQMVRPIRLQRHIKLRHVHAGEGMPFPIQYF